MARTKPMGLGAMFLLLVVAIVILPMIMHYINNQTTHFAISGFQDMSNGASEIPAVASASKLPTWRPDLNTNYICRSPNEDGQPCPEGQFCDGATQSCISTYVGGSVPTTGYYS